MAYEKKYVKQEWADLPEETTPLSAERLAHMEEGIDRNDTRMAEISSRYDEKAISVGRREGEEAYPESIAFGSDNSALNQGMAVGAGNTAFYAAVALGSGNTASSPNAVAMGSGNTASGSGSVALGGGNTASAAYAVAIGGSNKASGNYSFAEGCETTASGQGSHAEGYYTKASGRFQHVEGQYNVEDTQNQYAHIAGGGSSGSEKNIYTLDWQGNAVFEGDVTGGGVSLHELHQEVEKLLSGETGSSGIWYPSVDREGNLTWERTDSAETPAAVNIKGEPGGAYTEADKAELEQYIDTKFQSLTGDLLGGAS